jgi:hypothetical protein
MLDCLGDIYAIVSCGLILAVAGGDKNFSGLTAKA